MKPLYLDLDDTFVDTEMYCRRVLSSNGYKVPLNDTVYIMYGSGMARPIFNEIFGNYSTIPLKEGALESFRILETEYDIKFCSAYTTKTEASAKEKLAKFYNKEIILCESNDKSHVDTSGGIFVDDNPRHLVCSKCDVSNQYMMYNPFTLDREGVSYFNKFEGKVVFDWYNLVDKLMEVEEDVELREYIRKRIQELGQGSRV